MKILEQSIEAMRLVKDVYNNKVLLDIAVMKFCQEFHLDSREVKKWILNELTHMKRNDRTQIRNGIKSYDYIINDESVLPIYELLENAGLGNYHSQFVNYFVAKIDDDTFAIMRYPNDNENIDCVNSLEKAIQLIKNQGYNFMIAIDEDGNVLMSSYHKIQIGNGIKSLPMTAKQASDIVIALNELSINNNFDIRVKSQYSENGFDFIFTDSNNNNEILSIFQQNKMPLRNFFNWLKRSLREEAIRLNRRNGIVDYAKFRLNKAKTSAVNRVRHTLASPFHKVASVVGRQSSLPTFSEGGGRGSDGLKPKRSKIVDRVIDIDIEDDNDMRNGVFNTSNNTVTRFNFSHATRKGYFNYYDSQTDTDINVSFWVNQSDLIVPDKELPQAVEKQIYKKLKHFLNATNSKWAQRQYKRSNESRNGIVTDENSPVQIGDAFSVRNSPVAHIAIAITQNFDNSWTIYYTDYSGNQRKVNSNNVTVNTNFRKRNNRNGVRRNGIQLNNADFDWLYIALFELKTQTVLNYQRKIQAAIDNLPTASALKRETQNILNELVSEYRMYLENENSDQNYYANRFEQLINGLRFLSRMRNGVKRNGVMSTNRYSIEVGFDTDNSGYVEVVYNDENLDNLRDNFIVYSDGKIAFDYWHSETTNAMLKKHIKYERAMRLRS